MSKEERMTLIADKKAAKQTAEKDITVKPKKVKTLFPIVKKLVKQEMNARMPWLRQAISVSDGTPQHEISEFFLSVHEGI